MNKEEAEEILRSVRYRDWQFEVVAEAGILFLQIILVEPCIYMGGRTFAHHCRKWRISPKSTKSELVQTAFAAVMAAEEHEIRERFTFNGSAVFGPHFDIDDLVKVCLSKKTDMRMNSYLASQQKVNS